MRKQFKTERAVQQQKLICEGLIDLMQTIPYGEISVSRICIQAGIPRRTFYYYFDSKEDTLSFLIEGLLKECELESMVFADHRPDALEKGLCCFFQYWRDHGRSVLQALVRSGMEQELIMRCLKWVSSEERWMLLVANYTEEERSVSTLLGITSVFYTLFYWCGRNFEQSPQYMAACVAHILTTPLYRNVEQKL